MNSENHPQQPENNKFLDLSEIIDLNKYPINDLDNPITRGLINDCRERLDYDGCALIKDFIQQQSLDRMQAEADRLYEQTFW